MIEDSMDVYFDFCLEETEMYVNVEARGYSSRRRCGAELKGLGRHEVLSWIALKSWKDLVISGKREDYSFLMSFKKWSLHMTWKRKAIASHD